MISEFSLRLSPRFLKARAVFTLAAPCPCGGAGGHLPLAPLPYPEHSPFPGPLPRDLREQRGLHCTVPALGVGCLSSFRRELQGVTRQDPRLLETLVSRAWRDEDNCVRSRREVGERALACAAGSWQAEGAQAWLRFQNHQTLLWPLRPISFDMPGRFLSLSL